MFLWFMAFGCKTMESTQDVVNTTQNSLVQHKHPIATGTYLKDEGILGFLWYVKMKKLSNNEVVTQGYKFSFLNLGLFIVTIIVIASIRLKKEANLYKSKNESQLYDDLKKEVFLSTWFRRGMRLFITLTFITALIIAYYVVGSHHIDISATIALSNIIVSIVLYAFFVYGYWYFILKYTDISIKQSLECDDVIVTSKHSALALAILLIVVLTWFTVIGILSGLFMPLLSLIVGVILACMLKERT